MRKIKEIIGKSIFYKKIKFLIIRLMYIFPIQNKKVVLIILVEEALGTILNI